MENCFWKQLFLTKISKINPEFLAGNPGLIKFMIIFYGHDSQKKKTQVPIDDSFEDFLTAIQAISILRKCFN